VQVNLINLDRSPERLAEFQRRNSHLTDVVRFPAIDGRSLDRVNLVRDGVITDDLSYTPGAIGCAISHTTLWQLAIERSKPVTVAEDDAIFSHTFEAHAEDMLAKMPDWDIILWGWNFDAFLWLNPLPGVSVARMQLYQESLRQNLDTFQCLDMPSCPMKLLHCFGTLCYTISPKGAQEMLKACLPLCRRLISFPEFNVTIENIGLDYVMNAVYPSLRSFVCMPPLVVSENRKETSTVSAR